MRRIILMFGLLFCFLGLGHAQTHDQPLVEVFGGASVLRNGATAPSFSLYGGWQAAGSVNFNKYLGITADVGGPVPQYFGNTDLAV